MQDGPTGEVSRIVPSVSFLLLSARAQRRPSSQPTQCIWPRFYSVRKSWVRLP